MLFPVCEPFEATSSDSTETILYCMSFLQFHSDEEHVVDCYGFSTSAVF